MNSESERLKTFVNWPILGKKRPTDLAREGFYYSGTDVICAFCNVKITKWEYADDPNVVHLRESPECVKAKKLPSNNVPNSQSLKIMAANVVGNTTRIDKLTSEELPATLISDIYEVTADQRQIDALKCEICMENHVEIVFLPCGCIVTCSTCSAVKICPICSSPIFSRIEIEII